MVSLFIEHVEFTTHVTFKHSVVVDITGGGGVVVAVFIVVAAAAVVVVVVESAIKFVDILDGGSADNSGIHI